MGFQVEVYMDYSSIVKSNKDFDLIMDPRETFDNIRAHYMKINSKKCIFGLK